MAQENEPKNSAAKDTVKAGAQAIIKKIGTKGILIAVTILAAVILIAVIVAVIAAAIASADAGGTNIAASSTKSQLYKITDNGYRICL